MEANLKTAAQMDCERLAGGLLPLEGMTRSARALSLSPSAPTAVPCPHGVHRLPLLWRRFPNCMCCYQIGGQP